MTPFDNNAEAAKICMNCSEFTRPPSSSSSSLGDCKFFKNKRYMYALASDCQQFKSTSTQKKR